MGYQVPEHPVRQSLRLLLREGGIDPAVIAIERSNVPVQGAAQP
jgi:predicted transcriptional regulator